MSSLKIFTILLVIICLLIFTFNKIDNFTNTNTNTNTILGGINTNTDANTIYYIDTELDSSNIVTIDYPYTNSKQVIINNNKLYVLNTNNDLYCSDNYLQPKPFFILKNISTFSVDNNIIIYTTPLSKTNFDTNNVYYKDYTNTKSGQLPFTATNVSISNERLCCIYDNKLKYYPNYKNEKSITMREDITNAVIYNDIIACITNTNKIYYTVINNNINSIKWTNVSTELSFTNITIINNKLYGITNTGSIWQYISNIPIN
jgi:hypothetical protein